jgi:enterochelin esterase family protein
MQKILVFLVLCPSAVFMQARRSVAQEVVSGPTALVSPEVLPDHRVVFRLNAPTASEVKMAGDFWIQQNRTEKLVKDASGVWSLTTNPLPTDLYSYWFTVDGVPIPDPMNSLLKQGVHAQQSMFAVPGEYESLLESAPVPHGNVQIVYYDSKVLGKPRSMHVYLPPGYEEGKTRYPVVYLFHGGGDNDGGWLSIGRVNFALDNLIAQGKAKPIIVVMPSVYGLDPPIKNSQWDENAAVFVKTFEQEIMPYVDGHYRVLPGAENRALGGLGPGRDFFPDVLWPTIDKFGAAFFVSGGAGQKRFEILQKQYPGMIDNPANAKRVKMFMGDGVNDSSIEDSRFLAGELKHLGYSVKTYQTDGTHGWPSFRRCFIEWAQAAFR